jgi:cobalt transporter subunit CbtB
MDPATREPGDLPDVQGNDARTLGEFSPAARTEVVMAARTEFSQSLALPLATRLTTAVVSLLLGGFLIYGVGLAHSDALHDSAHDTRHSYGFPCH